jgi:hypothetical protein
MNRLPALRQRAAALRDTTSPAFHDNWRLLAEDSITALEYAETAYERGWQEAVSFGSTPPAPASPQALDVVRQSIAAEVKDRTALLDARLVTLREALKTMVRDAHEHSNQNGCLNGLLDPGETGDPICQGCRAYVKAFAALRSTPVAPTNDSPGEEGPAQPGAAATPGFHALLATPDHVLDGLTCWCRPYRDSVDSGIIIHRPEGKA